MHLEGIFPALVTPFDSRDRIDRAALARVIEYNINKGVQGFYLGGSTGESLLLNQEERKDLTELVVEHVGGRSKVIAHIGCFATRDSIELAGHAKSCGVDAISALPPFYYKFTLGELKQFYLDIVDAVQLPMIIYNAPVLTGVSFDNQNLGPIFDHPLVIGVKFTSYDLYQMQRIITTNPDKFVINGHDEIYLSALAVGSRCAIGSTFNFMSGLYLKMRSLFDENKLDEARVLQNKANVIIELLISIGVFRGVKGMLGVLGLDCGDCRAPFAPLTKEEYRRLEDAAATLDGH